ncbi:Cu(I)/Ag(I) efflux system membrane protein CusA/SilA [Salinibacter ruber]|jgi:Cu(I)/Ag(I) efflux system membrane protein CusA/SilA|uniref:Cu(I)/Ag(I) efflux system membrane protein CusA/SilA n=1 Tax=Salinibacter ruber TaxID=146919 RepID=A0A9X2QIU8_9BACT|nr:efflux RND transporter permease subunit [Salinibacter ruber]MCS3635712.1 Cu(I)/Ag(I) efflux system membrane protein CusA/SilA [Salinibacter ruber]MCS3638760.1 Cu(I)/Ag(I) efflux system membrane protein CusA/SilA [Salinibacter ruber]MCS3660018.1 Cu(I)/Ag(I) efflux system membrane protein CusA/SilA [Salinibacter ruber]MCS3709703.1 Cu(I)/Ag(I) efflux system membrane protein CusA/SilA [Salinibacter ruber]MCS3715198.1 Cu(I)/Ag(I) efflux system membrane protein CusA/SilA [Salinibacter ruber]
MLKSLIQWSAQNRLLVTLLVGLIAVAGIWATANTPIDAFPDLSPTQVIIKTDYAGQGPQVVEEQVTYPLTSSLMSVPKSQTVRGFSMFGTSFVYVIFEDGTDPYWARSRVLEYLNVASDQLPDGAEPALGPDATGVGWIFQYSLRDTTGTHDLAQLRSFQDFFLRYELQGVEGVSEIASVGGFKKEYQVVVDPQKLDAYDVSIQAVKRALKSSNRDVGGRLLEMGEREFVVRGKGYLKGQEDIRNVVLRANRGTPITIGDVARVQLGPELRRGIADVNGEGEVVGGIVVMRTGENALATINRVKDRLAELEPSLPKGIEITTEYDRAPLIQRAMNTLTTQLAEELLVVALIVILFLLHVRSALVAIITVPVGILVSMLVMYILGINANIMSLGGIAIAIGVMVDASLVMVENAHKHIERARQQAGEEQETETDGVGNDPEGESSPQENSAGKGLLAHAKGWFGRAKAPQLTNQERIDAVIAAAKEVGPSLFFSLLIVTVSFLPVFTLQQVEGRLFQPLAFTKTFAMAAASLLAVTLVPALMVTFVKGRIRSEDENPIARFFIRVYRPVIRVVLRHPGKVLTGAAVILGLTMLPLQRLTMGEEHIPFPQIGSEFMPPLNEGDLLYMPSTLPGVSPQKAKELLQQTDRIIASFPEVESVFGKIGRAETATDPAPLSMVETTVILKPESEWREGMTKQELISEMDEALQIPGVTNMWTQPIKTRIDMLATGIKTPVGIKVAGEDIPTLERIGEELEKTLRPVEGTKSVYSERVMGGSFLDISVDREEAARYGIGSGAVQDVIQSAIGGMPVTTTVEGLERYSVNVRYPRGYRDNVPALRDVLVSTPSGADVPLGQLASFQTTEGPPMIKSEQARPIATVFVDLQDGVDIGTFVQDAKERVREGVDLPAGYSLTWSGQYEYMERANERLRVLVPITLAIIFLLLFLHFKSAYKSALLLGLLPFCIVGATWLMVILGFEMSIAVGVGFIAVAGLAAETGVVMMVYLDEALERYDREGRLTSVQALRAALVEGSCMRVRPLLMTVFTTLLGLLPLMFATGTGAQIMKRLATPMVGGLFSAALLTLVVLPASYMLIQRFRYRNQLQAAANGRADDEREVTRPTLSDESSDGVS